MSKIIAVGKEMRTLKFLIISCAVLSLSACVSYDFSRRIVQQGNLLPEANIRKLHTGMSKETVSALLGTSLLSPMFTNERWDYAYTYRKGSHHMEVKQVSLFFNQGRLAQIEEGTKVH